MGYFSLVSLALALGTLTALQKTVTAIPVTEPLPLHKGILLGFERREVDNITTWVPSQAMLDEQASYYANKYVLDSTTNATILNPEYEKALQKRLSFNPADGLDCRMVVSSFPNPLIGFFSR